MRRLQVMCALAALLAAACAPAPPCDLRVCDIRDTDCQRMAAAAAACLRGVDPVSVPVTVVSQEDFIAQAAATLTSEQEESFRRWNAGLAALRLAPADNTAAADLAARAKRLGGVYSFTDKRITLIDVAGQPHSTLGWVTLLVHENLHAIQDAHFDLGQLSVQHANDLDRRLAFGSVFEGEAGYVADLAAAGIFGTAAQDIPWQRVFEDSQALARADAVGSPLPFALAWAQFRYPFGTAYVKAAIDARDWAGVGALLDAPPSGTREVMAGLGAAEPAGGPWAEDLGDAAVPVLGDGYDYVGTDRLGAWLFEVFLNRIGDYSRPELPPLLRSDALSIFQDRKTGGAVAVWRLRLSDASWSSYPLEYELSRLPAARLDPQTDDLIIVAASDAATLNAVPFTSLYQAIPPESQTPSLPPANWGCAPPAD